MEQIKKYIQKFGRTFPARKKTIFFANTKNILVKNAVTPVTPIAVTGNDEPIGKRVFKKFKTGIDFELNENLIYYYRDGKQRLCLFSLIIIKVFHLIYNQNIHANIHRCFNRLIKKLHSPFLQKISALHRKMF